jgi:hypothetical protein
MKQLLSVFITLPLFPFDLLLGILMMPNMSAFCCASHYQHLLRNKLQISEPGAVNNYISLPLVVTARVTDAECAYLL